LFSVELKDFTSLVLKLRIRKPDIIYISSFDRPVRATDPTNAAA
jgi:hypothetical protein